MASFNASEKGLKAIIKIGALLKEGLTITEFPPYAPLEVPEIEIARMERCLNGHTIYYNVNSTPTLTLNILRDAPANKVLLDALEVRSQGNGKSLFADITMEVYTATMIHTFTEGVMTHGVILPSIDEHGKAGHYTYKFSFTGWQKQFIEEKE